MKAKIKDYTTKIPAHQTIAEIQRMLAEAGALGIAMNYAKNGSGKIESLFFKLKVEGKVMPFKLPAKPEQVYNVLFADMQGEDTFGEQRRHKALNIAWRIVKDWLEVQLALIKLKQAEVGEIFLPYLLVDGEKTFYEISKERSFDNLISAPKE